MLRSWTPARAHRIACWCLAALIATFAFSSGSFAPETLYATSLRSELAVGTAVAGNLYVIDPSDAAARLVGAIRVGDVPVGIIAIATQPGPGIVYGITAGLTRARALVTI